MLLTQRDEAAFRDTDSPMNSPAPKLVSVGVSKGLLTRAHPLSFRLNQRRPGLGASGRSVVIG